MKKMPTSLVVVLALAAVAVAVAYATIPDSSGVIHGCYQHSVGNLRVIDTATSTCRPSETPLTWNAAGAPGPTGPPGPAGPPGPSNAFSATGGQVFLPGGPATLATLTLAPGAYAVTAKAVLADDLGGSVYVFCELKAGATVQDISATMVGTNSARQTVTLAFTNTFSNPTTVILTCRPTNPPTTTDVLGELSKIVAIKVASETH